MKLAVDGHHMFFVVKATVCAATAYTKAVWLTSITMHINACQGGRRHHCLAKDNLLQVKRLMCHDIIGGFRHFIIIIIGLF